LKTRQDLRLVTFTSLSLVILGAWNLLWYGLRHFGEFWGWSAIISGLAMILAAVIIFRERSDPVGSSTSTLGAVRGLVVITLAVSFILYAVTLIQLNMGLPILGV